MKHAYIKLEPDGKVSIRWWVDGAGGLATRALLRLAPGEAAFDLPFTVWLEHVGSFVDIEELRRDLLARPREN